MSRAPANFIQINDAVGAPVPAGLLYTYDAGTTTNKATYSDAALSVPNTNPVVANADGVVGPIYMTPNSAYKFVEKTAAFVTLRTEDNLYSSRLTSESTPVRLKQVASNPLDYGAIGDGVADESAEVQDAVDTVSGNGVVDLLGLTFRCDSQIVPASGVEIKNGKLDFSHCTDTHLLKAHGTLGTPTTLSGNILFKAAAVGVTSASGLVAGDIINIYDTDNYIDDKNHGELAEIESIAGASINLQGYALDAYLQASNGSVRKVVTVDDIKLTDLEIVAAEGAAGAIRAVSLVNCRRVQLRSVHIHATDAYAIEIGGCWDVTIDKCTLADGNIGILIDDTSQYVRVIDNMFSGLNTCIWVGNSTSLMSNSATGIPRHIQICRNVFLTTLANKPIHVDNCAEHIDIVGNRIFARGTGNFAGIQCNCVNARIADNTIHTDGNTDDGITMNPKIPNVVGRDYMIRVSGNDIRCDGDAIDITSGVVAAGCGTLARLYIKDNVTESGIRVFTGAATNAPIDHMVVEGNVAPAGVGINITSNHGTSDIGRIQVANNEASALSISSSAASITAAYVRGNSILGNVSLAAGTITAIIEGGYTSGTTTIDEASRISIRDYDCRGAVVIDNTTYEFTQCQISGNTIIASAGIGLEVDASDPTRSRNLSIVDNNITTADDKTIEVTGLIDGGVISNNVCNRGDDLDTNINLAGDAAGGLTEFNVTENQLHNGTYGITLANGSNVREFGNIYESMATGNTSGTFTPPRGVAGLILGDNTNGVLECAIVTLVAADIRDLSNGRAIATPGAGEWLQFIGATTQLNHGGNSDFTETSAPDDLRFSYDTAGGPACTGDVDGTTAVCASADAFSLFDTIPVPGMTTAQAVNRPIVLSNTDADYGGNAHNDNTLVVTLFYIRHTVA